MGAVGVGGVSGTDGFAVIVGSAGFADHVFTSTSGRHIGLTIPVVAAITAVIAAVGTTVILEGTADIDAGTKARLLFRNMI